jgi:aromatic-L-amino-acid decarboxylase
VAEETLDPTDWDGMRALGHRMVDDMLGYLETVRDREPWRRPVEEARAAFRAPVPRDGTPPERVYDDFKAHVLPYPTGNIHPRFWGWVMGTGTPFGMLAELLAAGMNPNVSGFDDAATLVENQVLDWLKELMGFPATASGLLVSGGSMANLVGLTVARNSRAGIDVKRHGVAATAGRLVAYASKEVHSSNKKAIEVLGLGSESLRLLSTDAEYRLDLNALEAAIARDRAAGCRPFCVVGSAGTVNTGATDDLAALADLCEREGLWLHVDGAFGALAMLSPALRPQLRGLERADSVAFDLHKWGYMPIEVGCALVRRGEDQVKTFSVNADYLNPVRGGVAARTDKFSDYGVQLSRGFRALKVWMSLREQGTDKLGRLVQQNVDQAAYLAERISRTPELTLAGPVPLNVVCFRFDAPGIVGEAADALNREILVRLHESGVAVPSYTVLERRFALRVAITNHRTRRADLDLLVDETVRLGRALCAETVAR